MTSLPVSVLVLGIGIVRSQSIGYWVLGAELGIVLTLLMASNENCSSTSEKFLVDRSHENLSCLLLPL